MVEQQWRDVMRLTGDRVIDHRHCPIRRKGSSSFTMSSVLWWSWPGAWNESHSDTVAIVRVFFNAAQSQWKCVPALSTHSGILMRG